MVIKMSQPVCGLPDVPVAILASVQQKPPPFGVQRSDNVYVSGRDLSITE